MAKALLDHLKPIVRMHFEPVTACASAARRCLRRIRRG
jgi:hypothetical protein